MKTVIVYPHKGIGNILFGMTRKEVEEILLPAYCKEEPEGEGIIKILNTPKSKSQTNHIFFEMWFV